MNFYNQDHGYRDPYGGATRESFNFRSLPSESSGYTAFRSSSNRLTSPVSPSTKSRTRSPPVSSPLQQPTPIVPSSPKSPQIDSTPVQIQDTQHDPAKALKVIKALQDFYKPESMLGRKSKTGIAVDVSSYNAFTSYLEDPRWSAMLPKAARWTYSADNQQLTPTQTPSFPHEAPGKFLSVVVGKIGETVETIAQQRFPNAIFSTCQSSTSRLKATTDRNFHERQPDNGLCLSYHVPGQPVLTHPPLVMEVGVSDGKKKLKRVTWAWLYGSYEVEIVFMINVISPRKDARAEIDKWRAYLESWIREKTKPSAELLAEQDDATQPLPTEDEAREIPDLLTDEDVEELVKREKEEAEASFFCRDYQTIRRVQRIELLNVAKMEPIKIKLSQLIGSTTFEDLQETMPTLEDQEFSLPTEKLRLLLEFGIVQMAQKAANDLTGAVDIPRVASKRPLADDILASNPSRLERTVKRNR